MDAINGSAVGSIANRVVGALRQILGAAFRGLLAFFGLLWIPDDIKKGVTKAGEWVWDKMKRLLHLLADPVLKLLGGEESFANKEATPPIVDDDGKTLYWLEKDQDDGEFYLMRKASPSEKVGKADKELSAVAKEEIRLPKKPTKESAKRLNELQAKVRAARPSKPAAQAIESPFLWKVGAYKDLWRLDPERLRAHHVGQKALMKRLVAGYDQDSAPAILVPIVGHNKLDEDVGIVSRSMKSFTNATQVVQRDVDELKRVYPNIPNAALRDLVELNKKMYSIGDIKI